MSKAKLWPQILTSGHDFYMQPRWSPDGRQVAWIAWDHPNMPWDGTLLYVAPVEYSDGGLPRIGSPRMVAGGKDIAMFQPEFTPDARRLLFVSDETGWGRLAICDLSSGERRWLTCRWGRARACPRGSKTCGLTRWATTGGCVYAVANERGVGRIVRIDLADASVADAIAALKPYTEVTQIVADAERRSDRVGRLEPVAAAARHRI